MQNDQTDELSCFIGDRWVSEDEFVKWAAAEQKVSENQIRYQIRQFRKNLD
jgi:hypothetical protein